MENQQIRTTINRNLYELDKGYKSTTNLLKYIDQAQDFYNGNQYPNANYKNMIRVTMNICSFAANIKASKLCGTPIYLTYTADNNETDCTALRQFDEYNCNKLSLKTHNFQSALNGFVNGTEIVFIRWDDDDTTYKGIYKGGLQEEHIDLRNFAVANPYIQDIQNQQWVMFWEDVPLGAIKEILEGSSTEEINQKKELLKRQVGKLDEDDYKNKDSINHALVRLYTRFFRIKGEVYFMCSTDEVDIFKYPHPLSRKIGKSVIKNAITEYLKRVDEKDENENIVQDYDIDYEDLIMCSTSKDSFTDEEYVNEKEKFSLYPFAVFRPFTQNRSFYGRSDIRSLIPIQRAINFGISMNLKCAENNAYNKILVKPEALQGQKITNDPGQVLTDYSQFTNGWGIKMLESQPMPNGLLDFTDRLTSMTRVIYGFNDVMDGSISNQDMSGYMLQQMIKQSNTALEQQQQLFWKFNEDKAQIRLMYYKHYVDKAKYTYELSDADYQNEEQARTTMFNALQNGYQMKTNPNATANDFATPTHKTKIGYIKNEDLWGINFDISIEAMQGLSDSKLVEQQMWDNLLLNGGIQNISPEVLDMYLQASPNVSPRTKTALNKVIENIKHSENEQLKAQLSELGQKTQQLMQYAKGLESQMGYQSQYVKNLEAEFTNKINQSNKINQALMKDLENAKSQGEVKSNNARGVKGTHMGGDDGNIS